MEIITGYKGAAHVTAAQDGATNAAIFGAGQYILNVSNKMAATKTDNNTVAIADGFGINQGRYFATAGENVTIETGTANAKREDLIVARYEKAASGVETIAIKVIKGTAGESYTTPSHTTGDIIAGASVDEMVLYKVHLNGATLEEIVKVAEVKESFGGGINLITSAAYNALSTEEKNKRDYLITDLDATPLDASVINYTDSTSVKTALDSLNNSLTKLITIGNGTTNATVNTTSSYPYPSGVSKTTHALVCAEVLCSGNWRSDQLANVYMGDNGLACAPISSVATSQPLRIVYLKIS